MHIERDGATGAQQRSTEPLPPPSVSPATSPPAAASQLLPPRWPAFLVAATGAAAAFTFAVSAAADIHEWRVIRSLELSADAVSATTVSRADDVRVVAACASAVGLLAAIVGLATWSHQAYRTASSRNRALLRYSPGWALGGWFVPIVNLVRPKQVVDDLWRASEARDDHREYPRIALSVHVWWALWVAGFVLRLAGRPPSGSTDLGGLRSALVISAAASATALAATVVATVITWRIIDRQRRLATCADPDVRHDAATRRPLLLAAGVAAAAVIAFAGTLGALGTSASAVADEPAQPADRSSATAPGDGGPASRTVFVTDLEVADCFESRSLARAVETGEAVEMVAVEVIDCADPHGFELIDEVLHPASTPAEYPGDDAIDEFARDECLARFDDAIGLSFAESTLDLLWLTPIRTGWRDGDRTIQCIATRLDGRPLTRDVIGSGM